MKIFLNTKSTGCRAQSELISIALVTETGETFYAENDIDPLRSADDPDFIQKEIVPGLDSSYRANLPDIANALRDWLLTFDNVTMATGSVAWDWHWVLMLMGRQWPGNLCRKPEDIRKTLDRDDGPAYMDALYSEHGLQRHNALDDAFAMRFMYWRPKQNHQQQID